MKTPFLGSLGRLLEALSYDQPRTLSYARCRGGGPAAWREQARAALLERMDFSPEHVPLDPRVLARVPADGYTRHTVEFASTRHHRLRGELLLPSQGIRRSRPCSPCTTTAASTPMAARSSSRG